MAYDKYSTTYHLTERGWLDSQSATQDEILETWRGHFTQASGFSKVTSTWELVWQKPGVDVEHLEQLKRRYPKPTE